MVKESIFWIILTILIVYHQLNWAYEANIYDIPHDPKNVIIEIVDDCKYSHKLLISKEKLASGYAFDWLQMLFESGEYNKSCKID